MDPITNQLSVGTQQQAQPGQQSAQMQAQPQIGQPVTQTAVGGLTQANPTLGTQSVANPAVNPAVNPAQAQSQLYSEYLQSQNLMQPNLLSAMQTPTPTAQPSALMSNMSNFSTGIQNYLNPLSGGSLLNSNQSYTYDPASQTFYLNNVAATQGNFSQTSTPISMAEMQAKADAWAAQAANNPLLGQTIYQPNAAGTMQQAPVGSASGVQAAASSIPSSFTSRLPPGMQSGPQLQQLWQQFQSNPMYQNIFAQQPGMRGGTLDQTHPRMLGPRPPMSQPMMPPQFGQNRFAEMQQRMMAMQPPQFGMRRHGDEQRDQYGNPIAAPVLYDRQMPRLMQRYGMM